MNMKLATVLAWTQLIGPGLMLLFLLVFLSGCAPQPVVVQKELVRVEVPVPVPVPAALLRPCPLPELTLATTGDLENALAAALISLRGCNDDKLAIANDNHRVP